MKFWDAFMPKVEMRVLDNLFYISYLYLDNFWELADLGDEGCLDAQKTKKIKR